MTKCSSSLCVSVLFSAVDPEQVQCASQFATIHTMNEGLVSGCPVIHAQPVINYHNCISLGCEKGGNLVSHDGEMCDVHKCDSDDNQLKLSRDRGKNIAQLLGKEHSTAAR